MPIGFTLPFTVSSGSVGYFQMTETEMSALEQDIRSLLVTNWGERPMHYSFGYNLREFIFEQRDEELKQRIADRINDQFAKWLPFVSLASLNILWDEEYPEIPENGMGIIMEYALTSNPYLKGSSSFIVFP